MTREFIFRAWDKLENKMYYNVGLTKYGVQIYTDDEKFPETILLERGRDCFEIMQSTGLLDKNGVKIFEGDIVRFWFGIDPSDPTEMIEQIIFEEGCFCMRNIDDPVFSCSVNYHNSKCEIIGNIHANPELLKGDNI